MSQNKYNAGFVRRQFISVLNNDNDMSGCLLQIHFCDGWKKKKKKTLL